MSSDTARKSRSRFFATKNFSIIIALIIFAIFTIMGPDFFIFRNLQLAVLDFHFFNRHSQSFRQVQSGVTVQNFNTAVHPDILILGVDDRSLADFGSWPFPRYRHADLLNTFTRIKDTADRESAVFLDFFFIEPSTDDVSDALLYESILENDRVFLETVLTVDETPTALADEFYQRQQSISEKHAPISEINGDWMSLPLFGGFSPPLKPLGAAMAGYGHANLIAHSDGKFRSMPLLARSTKFIESWELEYFVENYETLLSASGRFHRLVWFDKTNRYQELQILDNEGLFVLTDQLVTELSENIRKNAPPRMVEEGGSTIEKFDIYYYEDHLLPAVTLSLAAWHLNIDDISVLLGEHVLLKKSNEVVLRIPIDDRGTMLINFMGERSSPISGEEQTYPVRPYSSYARRATSTIYETWPQTLALQDKILMVGAFSAGLADDEKSTGVGQMYGIEIHANALNTILTEQFIVDLSAIYRLLLLAGIILLVTLITGRSNAFVALAITLLLFIPGLFIFAQLMFEREAVLVQTVYLGFAMIFTFLTIIIYRGLTEEREKKRVASIFGQYVSSKVVKDILEEPSFPELGGVDKEITICFTDIRGFTTLSENMKSQELVNLLNVYLSNMTDVILEHQGTLDKYIGDEIMSFWGAPAPQENHALLACKAAISQMETLNRLNAQWPEDQKLDIGIGINSGIVTVGNMGSSKRMNYTLVGDNVNLASRLEGLNKQYFGQQWIEDGRELIGTGSKIILSEYTYGLIKDKVIVRELDNIRVKGRNQAVIIYELIDVLED